MVHPSHLEAAHAFAHRPKGQRLPASYANFYVANAVVLLPAYNDSNDAWAASVLKEAFPGRRIVSDRLPGTHLGPGGLPLPDSAAAGCINCLPGRSKL